MSVEIYRSQTNEVIRLSRQSRGRLTEQGSAFDVYESIFQYPYEGDAVGIGYIASIGGKW